MPPNNDNEEFGSSGIGTSEELLNSSHEAKIADTAHSSNPFEMRAAQLQAQQKLSQDNAMKYLQQALAKSDEVTPTQGAAAALLAAIPTLGGYLIGKSVGAPNIPKGVWGVPLDKFPSGGAAGGLLGAQVGESAANDYITGLTADEKTNRPVYEKMAALEANKAERLQSGVDQVTNAGLAAQERRAEELDPALRGAKITDAARIASIQQGAELSKAEQFHMFELEHPKPKERTAEQAATDAAAKLQKENPELYKTLVPSFIPEDQRLSYPPELIAKGGSLSRANTAANSLNYRQHGGAMLLFGDSSSPVEPLVPGDYEAGKLMPPAKDAMIFRKEVVPAAENALGSLALAKDAVNKLGTSTSITGLSDEDALKVGALLQRVKEASLVTAGAMGQLTGITHGSGGMTDAKLSALMENSIPPIFTQGNINASNVRQYLLSNKQLLLGSLGEITNELSRRVGTIARDGFSAKFKKPISGIDINAWSSGGTEANGPSARSPKPLPTEQDYPNPQDLLKALNEYTP